MTAKSGKHTKEKRAIIPSSEETGPGVAALAKISKSELITGDPEFKQVEGEIKIGWLRRN